MCVCVKLLQSVEFCATLWTVACQAPLSMGFSRQEYWSGLPLPSLNLALAREYWKIVVKAGWRRLVTRTGQTDRQTHKAT